MESAERQVVHAVREIGRFRDARDQLEVRDALSERYVQLVRVDHSGERDADALSVDRFGEEVGIPCEERPSSARGAIE